MNFKIIKNYRKSTICFYFDILDINQSKVNTSLRYKRQEIGEITFPFFTRTEMLEILVLIDFNNNNIYSI